MRHHSSRKRACRRRTKSSGRQLVCPRLGSCVKASWLVDIDDAAQLAPSMSELSLPMVVLPRHHLPSFWPNYNFTQPARYPSYRYHTCGRVLHGSRSSGTGRVPRVLQRDSARPDPDGFLEASAEASRAVAGAGRRPPAGGRPLLDAFATGREVLQLYGPSCTVVPACST